MTGPLSETEQSQFDQQGFLILPRLFSQQEIGLLRRAAKEDRELDRHSFARADGEGGQVRLSLWNQPGEGIYGMYARCARIVDRVAQILRDEPYHYHSKMIMKDPRVGGAWTWHQDYGYWYQNGVLAPNLCSVVIAVDPATRENGCMQLIPGSHHLGRIDHVLTGEQAGADMERVNEVLKRSQRIYAELDPGDALFFHCNLLHRSDMNRSEHPRWSLICCYNARSNDPYKESHHPRYTPLEKVSDAAILDVGLKRFADDSTDVAWLDASRDASAKRLRSAQGMDATDTET